MKTQARPLEVVSVQKVIRNIFDHPILMLAPFVIILSMIVGLVLGKDVYRSSAVLTFQTSSFLDFNNPRNSKDFEEQKFALVNSLLIGEPLRELASQIWPDVNPEKDSAAFDGLVSSLRGSRGIQFEFKRDNPQALVISYDSRNPETSYRVVKNASTSLVALNRERKLGGLKAKVDFLIKEKEILSEKLKSNEREILQIRESLPPTVLQVYMKSRTSEDGNSLASLKSLDDMKINLSLAEKAHARLLEDMRQLQLGEGAASGSAKTQKGSIANYEEDAPYRQFVKLVQDKEQQLNLLVAKGYLPAHPERKRVEIELQSMRSARDTRARELDEGGSINFQSGADREGLLQLQRQIEEKKREINTIKDKIILLENYRAELAEKSAKQKEGMKGDLESVADRVERLRNLEQENQVTAENLDRIQKQTQVAQQVGRQQEEEGGFNVFVTEEAVKPLKPVPKMVFPLFILGTVLSAAAAIGLASVLALFDTSIQGVAELRESTSVPVLGQVDLILTTGEARNQRRDFQKGLLSLLGASLAIVAFFAFVR